MAQNTQTFILVGDFKDNITPKLRKLDKSFKQLSKNLEKNFEKAFSGLDRDLARFEKTSARTFRGMGKEFQSVTKGIGKGLNDAGKGVGKLESSLNDAARAAGKIRDTVSSIGDGMKGFDGLAGSMDSVARAAGKARDEVDGLGDGIGRAQDKAEGLMTTLLKAEGLSKMGDAISQGFSRGFGTITGVARKGAGFVAAQYRKAMEDEMADIKATTSVQGSFTRAGFKGGAQGGGLTYEEAGKFYKKFDVQIAEMIRTSSAPTSKVVELQRFTMDTLGPLLLAAENVPKGTNVKDITPQTIKKVSTTYGGMLEQIALLAQGTGTATFRVAQGVEGLIKSGKIDTTMDFFTDNVLLMQALQDAGFAGGGAARGGLKVSKITNEADRLKALQKALETAQSREGIKKMSESLTGSMQGLMDTLTNPSVGVFGMATTFSEKEQKNVDKAVKQVYSTRIKDLQKELKNAKKGTKRYEQLQKDIEREQAEVAYLTKEGASQITSPFKAFNLMFGKMIRSLTEALNAIGPIWNRFAVTAIQWTDKFLRPLDIALKNVASDMRADFAKTGGQNQALNIGRIFGEIYKFIGEALGDMAKALTDPKGALGKSQSQFMQGFYAAFKEKGSFEKAKQGMVDGITALVTKLFELIGSILTSEEMRPIVTPFVMAMFGPPVISAVISGITPLLISQSGMFFTALFGKARLLTMAPKAPVPRAFTPSQRLLGMGGGALPGAATAGAGAAAAGGGGGAIGGLLAVPVWGWIAALAAATIIFEKPIMAFAKTLQDAGKKMRDANNWFKDSFSHVVQGIGELFSGVTKFFNGLWGIVSGLVTGDTDKVIAGIKKLFSGIADLFVGIGRTVGGLGGMIVGAVTNLVKVVADLIKRAAARILGIPTGGGPTSPYGQMTDQQFNNYRVALKKWNDGGRQGPRPDPKKFVSAQAKGSAKPFMGSLGDAVSYEMANKPAGSHLVVANSSETIIPAAGGLGSMEDVVTTLVRGFNSLGMIFDRNQKMTITAINRSTQATVAGDARLMTAIKAASAAKGFFGGGGALGGGKGSLGAATQLAQSMGLMVTSGFRPGSPGYHGVDRARDYSNSTGPTPQMMAFAQRMAATFGSNITELIYTPLGYSIKNGKKVPPIAAAGHYNHVHVAFGQGPGHPTLFSSANAAHAYERMMAPAGARIASVTANSSEFGGGAPMTINQNITVEGAMDPRATAEAVWSYTAKKVQELQNNSFA